MRQNSSLFKYLTKESIMSNIQKVLLTGKTHTIAVDGRVTAGDHEGKLNIELSAPGNPAAQRHTFAAIAPHPTAEQLFAGAWSSCFLVTAGIVDRKKNIQLPADTAVEVEVDLGLGGAGEYYIQGRVNLIVPGLDRALATTLAHAADAMCPYSKSTRGNIDVTLSITTA